MPYQSVGFSRHSLFSLLTSRLFWAVISFFTNLAGFILVCSSAFLVDQFGRELKWSILTVFLVGIYIVPTLLFCILLWGPQIKNKFQSNLLMRVVLIYVCFIVVTLASYLNKYPLFHIKIEDQDQDSNSRKVYNLLSSGAFALTALGLSRAVDLQFEIGFFFYFLGDAMEVSLGVVAKNGHKNWGCIFATAIFCFLLIFLRCYLDSIHERHRSDATSQRRTQPPDASTSTTNVECFAISDIEASQISSSQAKANTNSNPTEASHSRIQVYSRASMVNVGSGQIESWLVDEDQWGTISPRVDTETSISYGEYEYEDFPPPQSTRSRVVKEEDEEEDNTHLTSGKPKPSDLGVDGDCSGRTEGSEDPGQDIAEQGDMRLPSPSVLDLEKTVSSDSGDYEKDDASLLVFKLEENVDQGQENGSQDSEKADMTHFEESDDHDHQSQFEELRDDIEEIIEGESRVVTAELGEREPKPQSVRTRDMNLSNLHLDDTYLLTCQLCNRSLPPDYKIYMYR
ncbi:hypothetical protein L6164_016961 [Bauhinia variegata]|uniref:Uncharacterized protein n=1 Tax=Bauhinia variegata TaxID=167791 RepID=A0ACB9N6L1_BAUVA|nr:hypothetical protein L6164_016961 [Bauhinia variegata]